MSDSKFLLASQLAPIHIALQEWDNAPMPERLAEIGTASRLFITLTSGSLFIKPLKNTSSGELEKDVI